MELSYITLDQMMSSVESDLSSFADEGMIDRGVCIKVIRKVNADLGLKINKERQTVIDIHDYKGEMPVDFLELQLALGISGSGIDNYFHDTREVLGTITEEIPVHQLSNINNCFLDCKGNRYEVIQKWTDRYVSYKPSPPLRLTQKTKRLCIDSCINLHSNYPDEIEIEDGYVTASFSEGKIYLNYLSDMSDEEGNLLILDHPLLTEYYEYAVKKHLLENWMLNNDADVSQRLMYIKNELRESRIRAMSFINTIEYSQIQRVYKENRKRFMKRYYSMFY